MKTRFSVLKREMSSINHVAELGGGVRAGEDSDGSSAGMMDARYRFIITLGKTAQSYGVSSVRLQAVLMRASEALGVKAGFEITPAVIHFVFQRPDKSQLTYFVSTGAVTFDMDKLTQVSSLVDRVAAGDLGLEEAEIALEKIGQRPPVFGAWSVGLGYVLSGAGFALLLSASWTDVFIAALLSAVVYGVVLMSARPGWPANTLEFASALVAGILASVLAWVLPGSDAFKTTLCGVVVLIPGLGLTMGLSDITANMIPSGLHRLISAILTTLKLFLGAMIGTGIVSWFLAVPPAMEVVDKADFWPWFAVAGLMIGLSMIFQVRRNDFVWTIAGGLIAYSGIVIGTQFGTWQGSLIGAMALGTFAYLYSWRSRRPSSIVMLTGIMILVPGAASYIGLYVGGTAGLAEGVGAEWQAFVNAMAIVAGLIVPYSILPRHATL